jgi:MFS family permease
MARERHGPVSLNMTESSNSRNEAAVKKKPENIPWLALPNKDQLFILALCRLSEPLSNTCLLPYIYYLIKSIEHSTKDGSPNEETTRISELSGLLVAIFPLAQFATSMLWARVADSHGRRPIIVGALLVSAISNLAFGFSRSFGALMFWRTLAGIANGNVGVMRTMTAEIVKERKYQTKAFLLLPLVFNSGMVAGLAFGGCLANPVENLPWLFGPNGIFNFGRNAEGVEWTLLYPYALPAMLNVSMLIFALILSFFWLRESLPEKEGESDFGIRYGRSLLKIVKRTFLRGSMKEYTPIALDDLDDPATKDEESKPTGGRPPALRPPRAAIKTTWTREVICALVSFCLLPLHNGAFMHIFPVFLSNPRQDNINASLFYFNGGLGLHSPSIGLWLSFFGVCGILLQLFIYPRMQARIGTLGNFRVSLYIFPITYALAPFLALLPSTGLFRWICLGLIAWSQIMARTLAIPSTVILLTQSAPAKNVLGTIHGAGNMFSSLARAIGPALGGWIFASGIDHGMVGAGWWFYLFIIAACALAWSYTMKSPDEDEE